MATDFEGVLAVLKLWNLSARKKKTPPNPQEITGKVSIKRTAPVNVEQRLIEEREKRGPLGTVSRPPPTPGVLRGLRSRCPFKKREKLLKYEINPDYIRRGFRKMST